MLEDIDSEILALFSEWCAALRWDPDDLEHDDDPEEDVDDRDECLSKPEKEKVDRLLELETKIAAIPAASIKGLACKLHIILRLEDDNRNNSDPAALSEYLDEAFGVTPGLACSLAKDYAHLVPELTALVPEQRTSRSGGG